MLFHKKMKVQVCVHLHVHLFSVLCTERVLDYDVWVCHFLDTTILGSRKGYFHGMVADQKGLTCSVKSDFPTLYGVPNSQGSMVDITSWMGFEPRTLESVVRRFIHSATRTFLAVAFPQCRRNYLSFFVFSTVNFPIFGPPFRFLGHLE